MTIARNKTSCQACETEGKCPEEVQNTIKTGISLGNHEKNEGIHKLDIFSGEGYDIFVYHTFPLSSMTEYVESATY